MRGIGRLSSRCRLARSRPAAREGPLYDPLVPRYDDALSSQHRQTDQVLEGMEKQLIVVGNSLAFVVDKSLRAKLGITSKTRLRVVTDGVRIIIEPMGKEMMRAVSSRRDLPVKVRCINSLRVLDALEAFGLDAEKFMRVTGHRSNTYRTQLELGLDDQPGRGLVPLQLAMDRLDACVDVLNTGGSWEQAIRAALSAVPATDAPSLASS